MTRGDKQTGCVFCLEGADSAERESLIVFKGTLAYVVLNRYPYNNGHLLVVPFRHIATLGELSSDEMQEVGLLTQRCESALNEAYGPHGMNVGINLGKPAGAGIAEHIHVHVVPRWNGDTNFMTIVGEMRVLPESLGDSANRLRPIFARLR